MAKTTDGRCVETNRHVILKIINNICQLQGTLDTYFTIPTSDNILAKSAYTPQHALRDVMRLGKHLQLLYTIIRVWNQRQEKGRPCEIRQVTHGSNAMDVYVIQSINSIVNQSINQSLKCNTPIQYTYYT